MNGYRLTGLIALVILVGVVASLIYYDSRQREPEAPVAFAPARSADESVPADEPPIEPPASLTDAPPSDQPAPETEVAALTPAADVPPPMPTEASDTVTAEPLVEEPTPEIADTEPSAAPDVAAAEAPAKEQTVGSMVGSEPAREETTVETPPAFAAPAGPTIVPTFDVVRVEPSGETVIAGLAEPEATVEVLVGPTAVATAEANERGEWALSLDQPLPPGAHDLAIRTTSKSRGIAILSDQRVAVSVPDDKSDDVLVVLNAPDAPSQVLQLPPTKQPEVAAAPDAAFTAPTKPSGPDEAVAESQVAMVTSGEPEAAPPASIETEVVAIPATEPPVAAEPSKRGPPPVAADEQPPAEPLIEPVVTVAAVEADTAGGLYVAGTAETREPVRIYLDSEPIGEATPSPSGTWLVETRREIPPGTYQVRADQVDRTTGDVIARAEVPFVRAIEVATLVPTATTGTDEGAEVSGEVPQLETVIIKRGDNLWRIARRVYGRGIRYSTIYQANRDQIRNPRWIYPGQVFVLPAGDANWKN